MKYNHPNTEVICHIFVELQTFILSQWQNKTNVSATFQVRNEDAENYFVLLKEWENLCKKFNVVGSTDVDLEHQDPDSDESEVDDGAVVSSKDYEVEKLVDICYGDPNKKKIGLHFKVTSVRFF